MKDSPAWQHLGRGVNVQGRRGRSGSRGLWAGTQQRIGEPGVGGGSGWAAAKKG